MVGGRGGKPVPVTPKGKSLPKLKATKTCPNTYWRVCVGLLIVSVVNLHFCITNKPLSKDVQFQWGSKSHVVDWGGSSKDMLLAFPTKTPGGRVLCAVPGACVSRDDIRTHAGNSDRCNRHHTGKLRTLNLLRGCAEWVTDSSDLRTTCDTGPREVHWNHLRVSLHVWRYIMKMEIPTKHLKHIA